MESLLIATGVLAVATIGSWAFVVRFARLPRTETGDPDLTALALMLGGPGILGGAVATLLTIGVPV
ncbi:hypothetical protein [Methylobacterium planeticum]|uniref:Uncharacterized protein n=1 Tax=Methylobacterium planeticum TaxID=2615211 RepID=A0A6N6MDS4_9HYPH|nr:hypothetical protein [Methylobacterium planeticum]KAB1068870.1 hypothetical protein F6X51_26055 [Methylobacterium planeticum]